MGYVKFWVNKDSFRASSDFGMYRSEGCNPNSQATIAKFIEPSVNGDIL